MSDNGVIAIGCSSPVNHMPECERDADRLAGSFGSMGGWLTSVVAGQIVSLDEMADQARAVAGRVRTNLLFSGHGLVEADEFALWLGNAVVPWSLFVQRVLEPVCSMSLNVTCWLDTCFAGKAEHGAPPPEAGVPEAKRDMRHKTLGTEYGDGPDIVADKAHAHLANLCVVCATGRNDFADGAFLPLSEGGCAMQSTAWMSLFSFCLVQQIRLAAWMEYVARANARYFATKNDWRTVGRIFDAVCRQQRGLVLDQSSQQWLNQPPVTRPHAPCMRKGGKHDGWVF